MAFSAVSSDYKEDEAIKKLNFRKLRLKFQTYQPPIRERLEKLERLFYETLGSDESIRLEWLYQTARKRDYKQNKQEENCYGELFQTVDIIRAQNPISGLSGLNVLIIEKQGGYNSG
jgi:hypothetical protein